MRLSGVGAAPGIAVGPAWRHRERTQGVGPTASRGPGAAGTAGAGTAASGTADAGTARTFGAPAPDPAAAAAIAATQLEALAERLRAMGRPQEAAIFDAQAMMATDPGLIEDWVRRIAAGAPSAQAIGEAAAAAAEVLGALDDELLAARAADVRDVGARLARIVTGETLDLPDQPSIAIADDLPPSVTAEIPAGMLLGIVLEGGSRTAHAVILARSLGIPAVVATAGLVEAVARATGSGAAGTGPAARGGAGTAVRIAVDGTSGDVFIEPTPPEIADLDRRAIADRSRAARTAAFRERLCATSDGERVVLLANIGGPADVDRALAARAEGVGLFRTEFAFMNHQTPPTEREQVEAYRKVFAAFGPDRPVVVRLADIGGDKGIPYLHLAPEQNPFLGVRAIRLAYTDRALLVTQLRAISAAAALAGVVPHVMAPMVATIADVELLLSLREEAQAGLVRDGLPRSERIVTGIMVEVPSAALMAPELARRVDFFSIGTNDLTQYLLAADRTSPVLAGLQEALHPAVLRCIRMVVEGADRVGIPVAVCGELAGDPAGALVLVGLGVDELSADAGSLDALRLHLAGVSRLELDHLAADALAATDGETVRAMADALLERAQGSGPAS